MNSFWLIEVGEASHGAGPPCQKEGGGNCLQWCGSAGSAGSVRLCWIYCCCCRRSCKDEDDELLPAQPLVQSQIAGIAGEGADPGRSVALPVRNLETFRPQGGRHRRRRRQPEFRFLRRFFRRFYRRCFRRCFRRFEALRFTRSPHQAATLYLQGMSQDIGNSASSATC